MKSVSSREFNQDIGSAKRAAAKEPVFITNRGRPSHVLLSHDSYLELVGQGETLFDAVNTLGMRAPFPEKLLDWEPPVLDIQTRPAKLDD